MRLLAAVERFLERTFERSAVRFFRAPLQQIQLERRLLHALELGHVAGPEGPTAPDRYRVAVHPTDLAGLGPSPAGVAAALADAALGFARRRGYRVPDRPRVELVASERVAPGDIRVEAGFSRPPDAGVSAGAAAEVRVTGSLPMEGTGVLPRRLAPAPGVRLVVTQGHGRRRLVPFDGRPVTIGRAPDNVVRIDDRRVSRHHARIVAREGALVLVDLGSTNGTWVDGLRVSELVLGAGDRIDIGAGAAEIRVDVEPSLGRVGGDPETAIGAPGGGAAGPGTGVAGLEGGGASRTGEDGAPAGPGVAGPGTPPRSAATPGPESPTSGRLEPERRP